GLNPLIHEIWQIAILPLDSNLDPRKDVIPFYIQMRPHNIDTIDKTIINRAGILNAIKNGHDPSKAIDLLENWIKKLELPYHKYRFQHCSILRIGNHYGAINFHFMKA